MKKLYLLALIGCAQAQTPLNNGDLEASPFAAGWINTGSVATPGFAPGSTQGARFTGSGQSLSQSVAWGADWHLDFSFMVRQTTNRQFSLIVNTGGGTGLNLRYQNGWYAFAGGWGSPFSLDSLLPSIDQNNDGDVDDAGDTKNVYHMRISGHNWGTASATYDLDLSDANGVAFTSSATGLSRFQATPTSTTPTSIKFGTEFGSNPGFWIDDISSHNAPSGPAPTISYFVANGNTLSWESTNATSLTLNPGGIDVTGLTSFTVSPASTTTYILTASTPQENVSANFTIGVGENTSPVLISEFLALNPTGNDWIELYNPNLFSINLADWSLSDNAANPEKFTFTPTSIDPGGFLIIDASDLGFSLSSSGEYLGLRDDEGTVRDEFSPTFPIQYSGVSYGHLPSGGLGYFGTPTPESVNISTPFIAEYQEDIQPDQSIIVSALVSGDSLTSVELIHRSSFNAELSIPMTDTGGGIYQATLPSGLAAPGEMLRWRIVAEDATGGTVQNPPYPDPLDSPRYYGTVIADPSLTTQLPIFRTFIPSANVAAIDTRAGTRCSVFWHGEFYDNVLVHLRGATTSVLEKKPHQFEFNSGHDFLLAPGIPRVDQVNINAAYPDSSYLRDILPMENLWTMGVPSPDTFPVRVELNNNFHSLGIMIEQPDNEFLQRRDDLLDPDGPLFKATGNGSWLISSSGFEARNGSDLADLTSFTTNLNGANQLDYLLENVDLPSIVNYLAVNVVDSIFNPQKNYYVHRNKFDEWMIVPWDRDFSYGHRWLGSGDPRGPAGPANFLVTDERYEWGGSNNDFKGGYNRLFDAIFDNPETTEMFYRRLRSTMDTLLAPNVLENRIEELRTLMKQEADLDRAEWGFTTNGSYRRFPQESFDDALDRIKNTYLPQRRAFLENDGGTPARGTLPSSQPAAPSITFGTIVTNPASGDQDDESLELQNPNNFAVDLSNWNLSGAISHTLRPGTVIPANSSLFLSPNIQQFRANNAPVFSQGDFSGHFSNFSETLNLHDPSGTLIATVTTPNLPTDNQLYLVISEIMYHPTDDLSEFIELHNTSDTLTLDLSNVAFTQGVTYTFPPGTNLLPGQRIVVNTFTSGKLKNEGETLKLEDADGSTISEFTYNNSTPWPTSADGSGPSLTFIGGNPDSPQNWRASIAAGGSPGSSDSLPLVGNDLLNYALTGSISIDWTTNTLTAPRRAGADSVELVPQWSSDLSNWNDTDFTLQSSEPLTWNLPNRSALKTFYRIKLQLR